MSDGVIHVGVDGNRHFAFQAKDPMAKLKAHFEISNLSELHAVSEIDYGLVHPSNDDGNFILITDINGWSYLAWSYWGWERDMSTALKFSEVADCRVEYYFVDGHLGCAHLVIGDKGKLERLYYHSGYGQEYEYPKRNLIQKLSSGSYYGYFYDTYDEVCGQSIEHINDMNLTSIKVYTGTFHLTQI